MINILMFTKTGTKAFPASDILEHINDVSDIVELQGMNWSADKGKIDFLTGKTKALHAEVAKPLTEEEATQALKEYYYRIGK